MTERKSKFDANCGICGRTVVKKGQDVYGYQTKNFGSHEKPIWKKVCYDCDSKFKDMYAK